MPTWSTTNKSSLRQGSGWPQLRDQAQLLSHQPTHRRIRRQENPTGGHICVVCRFGVRAVSNATRRPEGKSCAVICALSDLRWVGARGMTDKVAASVALATVPLFRPLSARGLCPGRPDWLETTSQSSKSRREHQLKGVSGAHNIHGAPLTVRP